MGLDESFRIVLDLANCVVLLDNADPHCVLCGSYEHEPECPWLRARVLADQVRGLINGDAG